MSIEETTCTICMENKKNVVFLPCGHMCTCAQCAPQVDRCPLCRENIVSKHNVFYQKYLKYKKKYLQLKK